MRRRTPPSPSALAAILADADDDDYRALPEDSRRALVAEAFHTFDEEAARGLAKQFGVSFDACAEEIERVRHPLQ